MFNSRHVVEFVGAMGMALVVTRGAICAAPRLGVIARPNAEVPTHTSSIPLLGGVAVISGVLPAILLARPGSRYWLFAAIATVLVVLTGLYKDKVQNDVSPWAQLSIQALAVALLEWEVRPRFTAAGLVEVALSALTCLTIINSWNFLDVVDGVACGATAISALFLFAIAALAKRADVAGIAAVLAGSAFGVLRYNFPPARIFLGDVGSFGIGLVFAACTLAFPPGTVERWTVAALSGVPIADFGWTFVRRIGARKSPLLGGSEHFVLWLLRSGWPARRILVFVCCLSALLGTAALSLTWRLNR